MLVDGPAGRLFVEDGGSGGTPVVFIHALAGNAAQWAPQLAHVRRTRRAAALDLRGHGRSDLPVDGRYDLEAYAADVRAVVDVLRLPSVVLVGHSLGGGVAAAFAGLWPDGAAGLLFVDPIDDPSKRPAAPDFDAFLARLEGPEYVDAIAEYWTYIAGGGSPRVRDTVLADLRGTPKVTVTRSLRAMQDFNAASALARYRRPMLSITTPLNAFPNSLHNVVQSLPREEFTAVGHWLHLDSPGEFNARLDAFLALVDRHPPPHGAWGSTQTTSQ